MGSRNSSGGRRILLLVIRFFGMQCAAPFCNNGCGLGAGDERQIMVDVGRGFYVICTSLAMAKAVTPIPVHYFCNTARIKYAFIEHDHFRQVKQFSSCKLFVMLKCLSVTIKSLWLIRKVSKSGVPEFKIIFKADPWAWSMEVMETFLSS